MDDMERIVAPIKDTQLFILKKDEVFILDGKFYRTPDEQLIIKSTNITGRLIRPKLSNGDISS